MKDSNRSSEPTEFPFTLPRGYVDSEGQRHKEGAMRLATAKDEVAPLQDPRVKVNPGYLAVILLARVITRLGGLHQVYPQIIEDLPVADFAYLQSFYRHINQEGNSHLKVTCPECNKTFELEAESMGEP
jgi:hypothetical protein